VTWSVIGVFLTVENWSKAPVKILTNLFWGDIMGHQACGLFGLILAAPLAMTKVKNVPLPIFHAKEMAVRPTTRERNRAIAPLEVFKNMFSC